MNILKIFFWGTPALACPSLVALHNNPLIDIVGVGVMPDKKMGRKQILTPCPVKQTAKELALPIYEIANKAALEKITLSLSIDLGIVIAFGMIFPRSVLNHPKMGIVNVHFSLLPEYRGASPVQSAILNKETVSGITWQQMVLALDAGDILLQKEYTIINKGTTELFDYWGQETAQHMEEFIEIFALNKTASPLPQEENKASFCGKFTKEDGHISITKNTATEIHHKALAFDLWPGIFTSTELGNVKIKNTALSYEDDAIEIMCKDNTSLWVKTLQIPGKKPALAQDVLRNNPTLFLS